MAALRFQNNYDFTDVPIPSQKAPLTSNTTVRRAKTLTRPERGVAAVPLINPSLLPATGAAPVESSGFEPWPIFAKVVTFWAPGFALSSLGGMKDKNVQQAWREKVALCLIIAMLCGSVGFATVGTQQVLCPNSEASGTENYGRVGQIPGTVGVQGILYNTTASGNEDIRRFSANVSCAVASFYLTLSVWAGHHSFLPTRRAKLSLLCVPAVQSRRR